MSKYYGYTSSYFTKGQLLRGVICTTPIRPRPTNFPPLGSLAIIQSLRQDNIDVTFYNIDFFRYSLIDVRRYFRENDFDFVGISAVVSTAYEYTKLLSKIVKEECPNTVQILGGNLAASAELILQKTNIDFCVLGDGELIIKDLISNLENSLSLDNLGRFRTIKGIAFLENGNFVSTGYAKPLEGDQISYPDYSILEADGSIDHFMPVGAEWAEGGISQKESLKSKVATVISTKGCVARCTFCHRWEKGFRTKSSTGFRKHLDLLKAKYGVNTIVLGDENFGSDKTQTEEIVQALKDYDMQWKAAGVRARTINLELLKKWKSMNAVSVIFGIESGSQKMLDVMQKNTTTLMNSNAIKWTYESGLHTVLQFVIGMPGETDETISETRDFIISHLKYLSFENGLPSNSVSINYAQALPGTPLYEYALKEGFIENTLDGEENYLLQISDTDAYSTDHFINYTRQPLLKVLMWRYLITGPADIVYMKNFLGVNCNSFEVLLSLFIAGTRRFPKIRMLYSKLGIVSPLDSKLDGIVSNRIKDSQGYFNFKGSAHFALLFTPFLRKISYPLLALIIAIRKSTNQNSFVKLIAHHIVWSLFSKKKSLLNLPNTSLRKVVYKDLKFSNPEVQGTMLELRMGR